MKMPFDIFKNNYSNRIEFFTSYRETSVAPLIYFAAQRAPCTYVRAYEICHRQNYGDTTLYKSCHTVPLTVPVFLLLPSGLVKISIYPPTLSHLLFLYYIYFNVSAMWYIRILFQIGGFPAFRHIWQALSTHSFP